MARLLLVARNPALAFGLAGAAEDIIEVRPSLVGRLEVTSGMADLIVIEQEQLDDALATLDLIRAGGLSVPALLIASTRPEWKSFDPAGRPSVAVLEPPITQERLGTSVHGASLLPDPSLAAPPRAPVEQAAAAPPPEPVGPEPTPAAEPEDAAPAESPVPATPEPSPSQRRRFGRKGKAAEAAMAAAAVPAVAHAEADRQAEEARLETERQAEEARATEEARLATERQAEEARATEEARLATERLAEEARAAEEARLEAERLAEEARAAEEARLETERLAEEARAAEEARLETERLAEEARAAEEARLETERLAEEARATEEARLETERQAEEARATEEARLATERLAEEARATEEARLATERLAEEARAAEEARLEAERLAEEARAAEEARLETERLAEEARATEEARLETERLAEEARAAEEARLETERLAEEARAAEEARVAEEAPVTPAKKRGRAGQAAAAAVAASQLLPEAPEDLEVAGTPYADAERSEEPEPVPAAGWFERFPSAILYDDEAGLTVEEGTPSPAAIAKASTSAVLAWSSPPSRARKAPERVDAMAAANGSSAAPEPEAIVAATHEDVAEDSWPTLVASNGNAPSAESMDSTHQDQEHASDQHVYAEMASLRNASDQALAAEASSWEPTDWDEGSRASEARGGTPEPDDSSIEIIDLRSDEDPRSTPALVRTLLSRSHEVYGVSESGSLVVGDALARTGATAAALLLPDGDVWRVASGEGLRRLEERYVLRADSWLVATIADRHKGLIIDRTDVARRPLAGAPLAAHKHLVAAPVRDVGGILLIARDEDPGFAERDLLSLARLAEASSGILAAALDARQLARTLSDIRDDQDDRPSIERIDYGL